MVVAKDSGTPPRQTSVPVVVKFEEEFFYQNGGVYGNRKSADLEDEKFTLTVVLGLLLTVFLIISVILVGYICKDKRKSTSRTSPLISPSALPTSSVHEVNGQPNGRHHMQLHKSEPDLYGGASGSTKSSSAESLPGYHNQHQVALNPLNPQSHKYGSAYGLDQTTITTMTRPPSSAINEIGLPDPGSSQLQLAAIRESGYGASHHDLILSSSNSRLNWPRNSIPRRVKKLSWEDENDLGYGYDRDITTATFTDPEISVTPMEGSSEVSHIGRAIYF